MFSACFPREMIVKLVNKFGEIADKIAAFDPSQQLVYHYTDLLESGVINDDK